MCYHYYYYLHQVSLSVTVIFPSSISIAKQFAMALLRLGHGKQEGYKLLIYTFILKFHRNLSIFYYLKKNNNNIFTPGTYCYDMVY